MKNLDVFKIATHNMWTNKSRTVLTVIIVTVVSTLIMVLLLIGTAFLENETNVSKLVLKKNGVTYTLDPIGNNSSSAIVPEKDYFTLKENAEKYPHIIGDMNLDFQIIQPDGREQEKISESYYITFDYREEDFDSNEKVMNWLNNRSSSIAQLQQIKAKDFAYSQSYPSDVIREGRIWTETDNDLNNIWVSYEEACELAENGVNIHVGDSVMIAFLTRSQYMFTPPVYTGGDAESLKDYQDKLARYEETLRSLNPFVHRIFTVQGIYNESVLTSYGVKSANGFVVGVGHFLENSSCEKLGKNSCKQIVCTYAPTTDEYNYNSLVGDMKSLTKEMNREIEQGMPELNLEDPTASYDRFTCDHIERMQIAELAGTLIMIGVVVLSGFVLLMSIGSVANTIIISVDKNRKFIGLMKSMGLNQSGVKRIVLCESLLSILGGVLLGLALLFALRPALLSLMTELFASIFGRFAVLYTVTASVPFWLPLATIVAFFLLAILFSQSSLSKIARQDVIGTINEVA